MEFGKFYNQSYLAKEKPKKEGFRKGPSLNLSDPPLKSPDFHRPSKQTFLD